MQKFRGLPWDDNRIIIHFDYDCFYASVVENENPALKSVPLAIQQKQIVVTCNYEARRRGLRKLQLITEAKKICPEAVIVLGEDISPFRNASKDLYGFLRSQIWSDRAEKLGFDEVWLDCTDMIDYNYQLLNFNDLQNSFFCMNKDDPTVGFEYDALSMFGPTYPKSFKELAMTENDEKTLRRLILGSHLARHLRHELEFQKGYTSTVGVATNKILSKLVGNVNKPKNQTTIIPPLAATPDLEGNAIQFMDDHDIGKVPGIGFKLAQRIRSRVLNRPATFEDGLVYGATKEKVTVRDVRLYPDMGPEMLEDVLSGPGSQKGIGGKIWALINGVDDTEVGKAKKVPFQISQEDSYMKYLHTWDQVRHQLCLLAERLIRRMQLDLMEDDDFGEDMVTRRWLAHPRTLRLTTRPRPPTNLDGTRTRTFHRISHSGPMPNFVFNLNEAPSVLAERLVDKTLTTMFRKLHVERHGWNLSLINVAATNMTETAADNKDSEGRDIGRMFSRQDEVLKDFRIIDDEDADKNFDTNDHATTIQDPLQVESKLDDVNEEWVSDDEAQGSMYYCSSCGLTMPDFAADAHQRFHDMAD